MAPVFANIHRSSKIGGKTGGYRYRFMVDGEQKLMYVIAHEAQNSGKNDTCDFVQRIFYSLPKAFELGVTFHARRKAAPVNVPVEIYRDHFLYYHFEPSPEISDSELEHIMMLLVMNGGHPTEESIIHNV